MPWSLFTALLSFAAFSANTAMPWRVRYVNLHVTIDPASHRIDGVARLVVSAAPGAPALMVDLSDSLTLDSARVVEPAARAVIGARRPGQVRFPIEPSASGGRYEVALWYHGQPIRRVVGFSGTGPAYRVASFGLPHSAREWWPVIDEPAQKADSADIWITAPANLTAVSNGRLVARTTQSGGVNATAHWSVHHPIYPDVISFAIGDYAVTHSTATVAGGRHVALEFYLFPEDSAKGAVDFRPVPDILAYFTERLGPYPFADEKYGLVEFTRPSFREGQTLSHLGPLLITGKHDGEQVFAHEIAHQWFGNSLTVKHWEDIWLNESLSEYMAWEWMRRAHGDSTYRALLDSAVVASAPAPIAPANPADFNAMFGNATFEKGPAVLVMLEQLIGTDAFNEALRSYVAQHAYGVVETADFQRACEKASGKPLGAFFAQWIRGKDTLTRLH